MARRRSILRTVLTLVLVGLAVAGGVALWPNVEAILTFGAFFAVIGAYLAASSWAQRRRRRGEEAGGTNAEGADAMTFRGWPG